MHTGFFMCAGVKIPFRMRAMYGLTFLSLLIILKNNDLFF